MREAASLARLCAKLAASGHDVASLAFPQGDGGCARVEYLHELLNGLLGGFRELCSPRGIEFDKIDLAG